MFLPLRLLAQELKGHDCWKLYLDYTKIRGKIENNKLRIAFLEDCKRADIIPRFLKFRIPNNGCFDQKSVHDFQRNLLRKEIISAKENLKHLNEHLIECRTVERN